MERRRYLQLRPAGPLFKSVAMKILEIFIVLGANCKFIDAFYDII
jgi:hypothetical protein